MIATERCVYFAFRRRAIHTHGHTPTRKSDESGASRDESGASRDESGTGWDESAAKATGMMLSQAVRLPTLHSITVT